MHHSKMRSNSSGLCFSPRVLVVLALVAMLVPMPGGASSASVQAEQAPRVAVGDDAVGFSLDSIDGETLALADLRGEKNAVIIFFRGTW